MAFTVSKPNKKGPAGPLPSILPPAASRESPHAIASSENKDATSSLRTFSANELARPDPELGRTALHWAAAAGRDENVRYILEVCTGTSVNPIDMQDELGWTPLMSAVSAGHLETIGFLLKAGANVMTKNNNGQSALHYNKGRVSVVELLLKDESFGIDLEKEAVLKQRKKFINLRDKYGISALSRAASANCQSVAELLIDKGAKLNAKDKYGNTALHIACESGNEALALFLVQKGLDKTIVNKDGKLAAELKPNSHLDY